jgi:hypothetical protein
MTEPRTKFPIESFGPELMTALLKGGRERLAIPFAGPDGAGKRKAHMFQRRIHTLRQRMRQENHPDYMLATRARVSLFWGERAVDEGGPPEWREDPDGHLGALIVIRPHDSEFSDILSQAGIKAGEVSSSEAPTVIPASVASIDDLLDDLKSPEGEK